MPRLEEKEYTYFTTVRGMCRSCRSVVPSRVYFQGDQVWMQSLCPSCSTSPALIAADKSWYMESVLQSFPDSSPLPGAHPPEHGCPNDCGPCTWHASPCQLPVVSITNACNLRCPICFTYNRRDEIYHMPLDEMRRTVDWIVESSGEVDLINLTGGEPTLHPQILEILACCQRPEIGRVTMNTNGITLAKDPALSEKLAEMGIYVILSFNTLDGAVSERMHGTDLVETKLRAIENMTRAGVKMTLLNVMARDVNENAIGGILDLMRSNDAILSLTVQTMTYTGQGGGNFPRTQHIPVDEATRIVCEQSGGMLEFADFMPRPSAHPLCYSLCYMLQSEDTFLPFARFAAKERIAELLEKSYLIRLANTDSFFKDAVNDLYAQGQDDKLAVFRQLIEKLFPPHGERSVFDRQRIAESAVRTIYIHSHMDEDTFDCSRAMMCPDLVPSEPGKLIPACTYNLFYRTQDRRFYVDE